MKRILTCIMLALMVIMHISASPDAASDVVVLLDTSSSVIPYFDTITDTVLCGIARNYVRPGDTFHLISFGSTYKLETAQTVQTRSDVESIVSRFMLLYPLDSYTDFVSALQYTSQYVSALRVESQKSVIIISDGIQDPAPDSASYAITPDQAKRTVSATAEKMKAAGWHLYYIKLPFPADFLPAESNSTGASFAQNVTASSDNNSGNSFSATENRSQTDGATRTGKHDTVDGKTEDGTSSSSFDVSKDFTDASDTSLIPLSDSGKTPEETAQAIFNLPVIEYPADLGTQNYTFTIPLRVTNPSDKRIYLELNNVTVNNANILKKNGFLVLDPGMTEELDAKVSIPESQQPGSTALLLSLGFAENQRTNPQQLAVTVNLKKGLFAGVGAFLPVVFVVIAALFLLFLIVLALKKLADKAGLSPASRNTRSSVAGMQYAHGSAAARESEQTISTISSAAVMSAHNGSTADTPHIVYSSPDTSSYKKDTITYEKPSYGTIITDGKTNETLYDAQAASLAAANQKNTFAYTLKKDHVSAVYSAEEKKRALFAAADPNERIQAKTTKNAMLELYVYNQSRMIGKRNIHIVKPGHRYSIGGGTSSFLVFLVNFPRKIAELRYDGESCTLAIFKPQYFPNETSAVIENCIDREFCLVSDKGYPVTFKFREYEDPIEKYNRLIQSIKYD